MKDGYHVQSAGVDNSQLTHVCKQAPRPHCASFNHVSPRPAPHFTSASLQREVAPRGMKQPAIQLGRGGGPLARPPPVQREGAGCLRFHFLGLEVAFEASSTTQGFPGGSDGKESACGGRGCEFGPWVGKIPWRRKWPPTPECLAWRSSWTEEPGGLHIVHGVAKSRTRLSS